MYCQQASILEDNERSLDTALVCTTVPDLMFQVPTLACLEERSQDLQNQRQQNNHNKNLATEYLSNIKPFELVIAAEEKALVQLIKSRDAVLQPPTDVASHNSATPVARRTRRSLLQLQTGLDEANAKVDDKTMYVAYIQERYRFDTCYGVVVADCATDRNSIIDRMMIKIEKLRSWHLATP
jgi:hypothetical protein